MNRISREKRRIILQSLVEGASIRSTARIANVAINTVIRLLIHAGDVCDEYSDHMLRNLQCERLELDEVWCFCYAKNANVPFAKAAPEIAGDVWTWVAIDPDTKLVPCWMVGERDGHVAWEFLQEIKARMAFGHRLQITTDGWKSYKSAIPAAFKDSADHAVLNKKIIRGYDSDSYPDHRYSQRQRYFITKEAVRGNPDMDKAVTSHIEREFLNLRMGSRRYTRLTNGFSKRIDNHVSAVSLHFCYHNFCRIHTSLGTTPAVAAGILNEEWDIDMIIDLIEIDENSKSRKRGPYKKRGEIDFT